MLVVGEQRMKDSMIRYLSEEIKKATDRGQIQDMDKELFDSLQESIREAGKIRRGEVSASRILRIDESTSECIKDGQND